MVKFKAKTKNGKLIVKAKISSDGQINAQEIETLSAKVIRGFMQPKQVRKNVIEYSCAAGVSLYEHLKKPISKYEFFYIMAQIIDCTRKIENNNLFLDKLILDLRYVYINETTKEVQFIYIPTVSNHTFVDVIGFIKSIIYSVRSEENTDYISQYTDFIKSLDSFNPDKIDEYISLQDKNVANHIRKRNSGQSGFITDNPADYYEHYYNKNEKAVGLLDNEATCLLEKEDDDEATSLLENDETALLDEYDGTTVLPNEENNCFKEHFAYLFRVSTEEKIIINKPVFRIGKEKSSVDYFVSNNNAVSRNHADIITRGKRFFIYDHNSTNHTYIDGNIVPVKVETEIFDGNTLMLANEEFVFHASTD